jgi:hypothetical protein
MIVIAIMECKNYYNGILGSEKRVAINGSSQGV